jgi:hypothetical protein
LVGSGCEKEHEGRDTSACSQAATPARDLAGECLAELARPLQQGFVAHKDAAGGQHLFHHARRISGMRRLSGKGK